MNTPNTNPELNWKPSLPGVLRSHHPWPGTVRLLQGAQPLSLALLLPLPTNTDPAFFLTPQQQQHLALCPTLLPFPFRDTTLSHFPFHLSSALEQPSSALSPLPGTCPANTGRNAYLNASRCSLQMPQDYCASSPTQLSLIPSPVSHHQVRGIYWTQLFLSPMQPRLHHLLPGCWQQLPCGTCAPAAPPSTRNRLTVPFPLPPALGALWGPWATADSFRLLMPIPTRSPHLARWFYLQPLQLPISVDGWPVHTLLPLCGTCFPFHITQLPGCLTTLSSRLHFL